jgi:hypothetical protein
MKMNDLQEGRTTTEAVCAARRSAELHSAVSPSCTRQGVNFSESVGTFQRPADLKSAIQQSATLRYVVLLRHALLHFQSSGAVQRRAFTGLFTT